IFTVILQWIVFLIYYHYRRDVYDLHHAILGILYSVLVIAVITDIIKYAVGRLRPKIFYRCFPDRFEAFQPNGDVNCHGDPKVVKEGYKSFTSGLYACQTLGSFAAELCIVLLALLFAALVGISRIDDYWHHWTDLFTGSIIGWAPQNERTY
uniref:Phosphatidic acid phosphatase type 2/haloperoxidase domain-containing protein n=1 Tax=Solanum lycopersicum TaxID=4081 RepID=A0A3Q7FZG8_SOLLC